MNRSRVIPSAVRNPLRMWPWDSSPSLRLGMTLVVAFLTPTIASACPVCFGDPNSAMTKGTNNGVFFLLGVIGFVQIGLGAMFIAFWRRARGLRARRDAMRVINGGFFR